MAREKLGEIELAVLDKIRARLEEGQHSFGKFKLSDPRNFPEEASQELFDACVYMGVQLELLKEQRNASDPYWEQNYAAEVQRTAGDKNSLVMGALGLAGEAGEVVELVKKASYHDHDVQPFQYVHELGDVLWYVQYMCNQLGYTLKTLAQANTRKLRARYPEGFDPEKSRNRSEE